jgi:23S rRNA G2445 N2-methylase RlmL
VDGAHATIGLRIADRPLHRRAYKRATVAGTLHTPLAAAMVRLAGAGTLLAEARLAGAVARLVAIGCDQMALAAATLNGVSLDVGWLRQDGFTYLR